MNRRAFLTNTGLAAAATTLPTAFPLWGRAQGISANPTAYSNSGSDHAAVLAFYSGGASTQQQWTQLRASLNGAIADWMACGGDSLIQTNLASLTPDDLCSANINAAVILQAAQQYNPSITWSQVMSGLQVLDSIDDDIKQTVLNQMRSSGASPYLTSAVNLSYSMQPAAAAPTGPNPTRPGVPGGGAHGNSCGGDGMAVFAVATAFAVIAVMSAGTAPILMGAAWGAISFWGGTGAALWGAGHVMACGF